MAAAREGAGGAVGIMVDLHGRTSAAMAIQYAPVLEPCRPSFIEEPCQTEDWRGTSRVARSTRIPVEPREIANCVVFLLSVFCPICNVTRRGIALTVVPSGLTPKASARASVPRAASSVPGTAC